MVDTGSTIARICFCLTVFVSLGFNACSSRQLGGLDENLAAESLKRVLDSWRRGETMESLKQQSPSIIVNDPAWAEGRKLTDYKLKDAGKSDGRNLHCTVELFFAGSGADARQSVTYIVGTHPVITVFRDNNY